MSAYWQFCKSAKWDAPDVKIRLKHQPETPVFPRIPGAPFCPFRPGTPEAPGNPVAPAAPGNPKKKKKVSLFQIL